MTRLFGVVLAFVAAGVLSAAPVPVVPPDPQATPGTQGLQLFYTTNWNEDDAANGEDTYVTVDPLVVSSVIPRSPAGRAGFKLQDKIRKVGNTDVFDRDIYTDILKTYRPGAKVPFEVERNGERVTLTVELDDVNYDLLGY